MKRDIEIAREIQRWLLPGKPPDVPGVDIAFVTRPAKIIGGDCYDVFRRATDGPLLIAVADVSGKSVPAAMLMATFQASLRALADTEGSLSELVAGLNRQLGANSQHGRFTTAFLAEMDPATGDLSYLCAGHNPPILKREDGRFERLQSDRTVTCGWPLNVDQSSGLTSIPRTFAAWAGSKLNCTESYSRVSASSSEAILDSFVIATVPLTHI
jgi:serine phosphatase RsbU (regulator of sigma subunit)